MGLGQRFLNCLSHPTSDRPSFVGPNYYRANTEYLLRYRSPGALGLRRSCSARRGQLDSIWQKGRVLHPAPNFNDRRARGGSGVRVFRKDISIELKQRKVQDIQYSINNSVRLTDYRSYWRFRVLRRATDAIITCMQSGRSVANMGDSRRLIQDLISNQILDKRYRLI